MKQLFLFFILVLSLLACSGTAGTKNAGAPPPVTAANLQGYPLTLPAGGFVILVTTNHTAPLAVTGGDWWHDAVFYQIFAKAFAGGKLPTERLDYLARTGFTAVWTTPIFASPSPHGYDTTDYRIVDPSFGGMPAWDEYRKKADSLGIRLVLDLVLNHTGSGHPWFRDAERSRNNKRDWYIWSKERQAGWMRPWGGGSPSSVWHWSHAAESHFYGAFWQKPLWDSDKDNDGSSDSWFAAPNILTIAKIAGSVCGGGPWFSFALDALDTAANVAMGNMSLKDGAIGLAKSGATAAVGSLTAGLGDKLTASWSASIGTFGGAALAKAASMSINQVAQIGINGFSSGGWDVGGWKGLGNKLGKAAISVGVSSVAAGISHSIIAASGAKFVQGKDGKYGWEKNIGSTGNWYGMNSIKKLGGLAGGLFEQGANFALGRDVTLNLANFGMFGGRDVGFLEFGFNRKSGVKGLQFGMEGLDVSASAIASAFEGGRHMNFLNKMENSGGYRNLDKLSIINMMGRSGDKTALATADGIVDGELHMMFDKEYQNRPGENPLSLARNQGTQADNGAIFVSDKIRSDNLNDLALGAVAASHSGGFFGYGDISADGKHGVDGLWDIDANVWSSLRKQYGGLQDWTLNVNTILNANNRNIAINLDFKDMDAAHRQEYMQKGRQLQDRLFEPGISKAEYDSRKAAYDAFLYESKKMSGMNTHSDAIIDGYIQKNGLQGDAAFSLQMDKLLNRIAMGEALDGDSIAKLQLRDGYRDIFQGYADKTGDNIKTFAINMVEEQAGARLGLIGTSQSWRRAASIGWATELGNGTTLRFSSDSWDDARSNPLAIAASKVSSIEGMMQKTSPEFYQALYAFFTGIDAKSVDVSCLYRTDRFPGGGSGDTHYQGRGIDITAIENYHGDEAVYYRRSATDLAPNNDYMQSIRDYLDPKRSTYGLVLDPYFFRVGNANRNPNPYYFGYAQAGHFDHMHLSLLQLRGHYVNTY